MVFHTRIRSVCRVLQDSFLFDYKQHSLLHPGHRRHHRRVSTYFQEPLTLCCCSALCYCRGDRTSSSLRSFLSQHNHCRHPPQVMLRYHRILLGLYHWWVSDFELLQVKVLQWWVEWLTRYFYQDFSDRLGLLPSAEGVFLALQPRYLFASSPSMKCQGTLSCHKTGPCCLFLWLQTMDGQLSQIWYFRA